MGAAALKFKGVGTLASGPKFEKAPASLPCLPPQRYCTGGVQNDVFQVGHPGPTDPINRVNRTQNAGSIHPGLVVPGHLQTGGSS